MKAISALILAAVCGASVSSPAAAPVIDPPIPFPSEPARVAPILPVGKTLLFPITASDADGDALCYKVSSSNPNIMVRAKTGNPTLRLTINHAAGVAGDPAYSGTMEFMVFRDWLPITSRFVAGMAQAGFYDNVIFHRLADLGGGVGTTGFIFQGGDPNGTGGGGPGMTAGDPQTAWKFQNEFHVGTIFSGRGQLAMANAGTTTGYSLGTGGTLLVPDYLDTNGSQFFITDGQPRHLDFKHNIFGQMLRGWELLPKLQATKTTSSRPDKDVTITAATVVPNETDAVLVLSAKAVGTALITVTAIDPTGAKAVRTFVVRAVADETNDQPFIRRLPALTTPKDLPAVFALQAVDLEFDYLDIQHSMLPLSASIGPKGSLLASSGRVVQMQPTAGYVGAIAMGFSIRQFNIAGGGFNAIADYTNAYIAAGDRDARGEGVNVAAQPTVALANAIVAKLHDLDPAGVPGNFTAKINWGDGMPLSSATLVRDPSSPDPSLYLALGSHTYAKAGVYPVVVDFLGNNAARSTAHSTACVSAASLRAFGERVEATGARVVNRMLATFTDASPGAPSGYTATVNWGDGFVSKGTVSFHSGTGKFLVWGTHGYLDSEPYTVSVRIHKKTDPPASDAFAWTTIEPSFAAPPHLPPFPHGKLTIAWNSGPTKSVQGTPGPDYQVTYNGVFVLINTGNRDLGKSVLRFWLSPDRVLDRGGPSADLPVLVNGQPQLNIIPFPAGAGGSGQFALTLPKGQSSGRKFLMSEVVYNDPIANADGTDKVLITGPLPPTILLSQSTGLITTEGGGTASFTAVLDTPPTDQVTIPLESSLVTEGTVAPSQLVFTKDNWYIPQTVTVTGVDDSVHDGDKTFTIKLKAAVSTDTLYNGFLGGPAGSDGKATELTVSVTNKDNDP